MGMLLTWFLKGEEVGIMRVEHSAPAVLPDFVGGGRVDWVVGPGGGVKKVRLNRKNPHTHTPCWAWCLGGLSHVFGRD